MPRTFSQLPSTHTRTALFTSKDVRVKWSVDQNSRLLLVMAEKLQGKHYQHEPVRTSAASNDPSLRLTKQLFREVENMTDVTAWRFLILGKGGGRVAKLLYIIVNCITTMLTHCESRRKVVGAWIKQPSRLTTNARRRKSDYFSYTRLTLRGGVTNSPARLVSKHSAGWCCKRQKAQKREKAHQTLLYLLFCVCAPFSLLPGFWMHQRTESFETCRKVHTLRVSNMYDIWLLIYGSRGQWVWKSVRRRRQCLQWQQVIHTQGHSKKKAEEQFNLSRDMA